MPKVGEVLAPQQTLTASVSYNPEEAGNASSFFSISSDQGSVTVPCAGTAVTGRAIMSVSPEALDFGTVRVGSSATLGFRVEDTGSIFLIVTRAAPPAGVFTVPVPMAEGITLDPDTGITQRVVFRPTRTGHFEGQYRLNGTGGQGWITVQLVGTGVS